jgi:hypothetical protein
MVLCKQGALKVLSSLGQVFQMSVHIYTFEATMGEVWLIPEMPSRHLSYCSGAK